MAAGGKSVVEKLGVVAGRGLRVTALPVTLAGAIPPADDPGAAVLLGFVTSIADVAPALADALPRYRRGGALWFGYPKKSGAIRSDISRDHGWQALADAGLLPVTQIALDADWSALRFRYRDEIARLTRKSGRIEA